MFSIAIKNLRANLARFVATLVAIATGVGFLTAGNMLTASIRNSLGGEVDRQYAAVSAAIQPANADQEKGVVRSGVSAETLPLVRAVQGVKAAAGEVQGTVAIIERGARVDASTFSSGTTARNWIEDSELNPIELESGRAPRAAKEVTVDRGLAKDRKLSLGQPVQMSSSTGIVTVRVVGITRFGTTDAPDSGGTVTAVEPFVFDLAGTGKRQYARIIVTAESGVSETTITDRLSAVAPTGSVAVTGDAFRTEAKGQSQDIADFLKWPLWGFSGLALFVCGFVISNTFSVVVSQRIREFALMRAVAATPRQVRRSLRFEGIGIGLLGSVLGIGLGVGLMFLLSKVLQALDLSLPAAQIVLTPAMVAIGLAAGTLITALSTFMPAFRAGRTAPVAAMRDAAAESRKVSKARVAAAAIGILAGIGLMLTTNGVALAVGAPVFLIGVLLAGPLFARAFSTVSKSVLRHVGMAPRLSADNIARNPKRTSTTINALVIGLFLVTLVTIAGASFKATSVKKVNEFSSADLIIASSNGSLPAGLLDKVEAIDGVSAMARLSALPVRAPNNPAKPAANDDHPDALTFSDPKALTALGLKAKSGSLENLGDGVALLDLSNSLKLGDVIPYTDLQGRRVELPVTAILDFSVDALSVGNLVSAETLAKLDPTVGQTGALIKVDSGSLKQVSRKVSALTVGYGSVQVIEGNIFGRVIGAIFDFIINAVNGLLGMSVLIALIGIVNTMTLSIFERRREIGLLRAVGMTPREVRNMIGFESVQVAVLGTIVGMGSGALMGWLLIRASNFSEVSLDTTRLIVIFIVGVGIGVVASIVPIIRVNKLEVLDALATS